MKPLAVLIALSCSIGAYAQPATLDGPFQIRYASNLTAGDSVVNITNTGANGNNLYGPGFGGPFGMGHHGDDGDADDDAPAVVPATPATTDTVAG